jgi:hypothetical protein
MTSIAWVSSSLNGAPGRNEKKMRMRLHTATGFVSQGKQLTDGLLQRLIVNGERSVAGNAIAKKVSPLARMWAANPDDRASSAAIVVCMETADFCLAGGGRQRFDVHRQFVDRGDVGSRVVTWPAWQDHLIKNLKMAGSLN